MNTVTIPSGTTVNAFPMALAPIGQTCVAEARTCTNGTLSGSATSPSCLVHASQMYVAPNGNDQASGDISNPLATITQAQRNIQQFKAASPGTVLALSVTLRSGTYYLPQTLVFTAADSGWASAPIVYSAYPGEKVVVSGGQPLSNWTPVPGAATYSAPAPAFSFRQLYIGDSPGTHPIRARYPKNSFLTLEQYHFSASAVSSIDLSPDPGLNSGSIPITSQTELVILKSFTQSRLGVNQVTTGTNSYGGISIQLRAADAQLEAVNNNAASAALVANGFRAYFEGSIGLLSRPGEWALSGTNVIYYPRSGDQLSSAVVPKLEQLITIGAVGQSNVNYLTFSGLEFHHTTWNKPSVSGYVGAQAETMIGQPLFIPSAITVNNALAINFNNCRFAQLGGGGLAIESGVTNSVISGNLFDDIAGNGLNLDNSTLANLPISSGLSVTNNIIEYVGQDYDGVGILAALPSSTTIANNLIQHVSYTGVSLGWGQVPAGISSNVINANEITDVMQLYDDGAAIYTLGPNPNTQIINNYIHDFFMIQVPNGPGLQAGLYFDGFSSGVSAQNNLFSNITQGVFFQSCCGAAATSDSAIVEHMVNVANPLAIPSYDTPAFLSANNDQFAYDGNNPANIIPNAGPNSSVRAIWKSLSSGIPIGLFQANGGILYNYGTTYCGYANPTSFTQGTGLTSAKNIAIYSIIPATENYLGACP
ncbi:MAG: right-handed parallel beta-helix repeat-containing protein [Limisphaerales bacterium]